MLSGHPVGAWAWAVPPAAMRNPRTMSRIPWAARECHFIFPCTMFVLHSSLQTLHMNLAPLFKSALCKASRTYNQNSFLIHRITSRYGLSHTSFVFVHGRAAAVREQAQT